MHFACSGDLKLLAKTNYNSTAKEQIHDRYQNHFHVYSAVLVQYDGISGSAVTIQAAEVKDNPHLPTGHPSSQQN